MKRTLLFFCILIYSNSLFAANILRSDSIDIKQTILHCDITDFVTKQIKGHANILVESKINGQNKVVFDLEGMQIDSVKWNGSNTTFSLSGFYLTVNTPTSFDISDTARVDIFYQGMPVQDPTWGGFYFFGNYGFQMGVGFNAQPHSVGRFWHPCFDNMVERSSYEFYITTRPTDMGVANGLFLDSSVNTNGNIVWHYKLSEEIPSYLAATAVSNYVWVKKTLNGNSGVTPAWIASLEADTNSVNGSFANLQSSFSMLEKNFGTHSFSKVGYTLVPFSAGAMEHATNIHIGQAFINGTLAHETLIAHELAHHWWGDLVTCRTVQDMWLNEGWASYSESLHEEFTYSRDAYDLSVRDNHFSVLSSAHVRDGGYKAISPMDSLHTYGPTVYNKGADYVHTLRHVLGDSLFFGGTTAFLNANKFSDISSYDLRDFLTSYSGKNMTPFFDDFIFQSGFPHYGVDSMTTSANNGQFETSIFLRHRKHQAPNYYSTIPMEIGVYDQQFNKHLYKIDFTGRCMQLDLKLPYEPLFVVVDPYEKISDATTENELIIKSGGFNVLEHTKVRAIISDLDNSVDSALLRIEHHWIAPDRFKQSPGNGFVLNDKRYWRINGINLSSVQGIVQYLYDGTNTDNYIDSSWIQNSEDSIRLFYRKNAAHDWTFANDSLKAFVVTDKRGSVYLKEIKAGEYCFGIQRGGYNDPLTSDIPSGPCSVVTGINDVKKSTNTFQVYPNPSPGYIILSSTKPFTGEMQLYSLQGKKLYSKKISLSNQLQRLTLPDTLSGIFILKLQNKNTSFSQKIVIEW